MGDAQFVGLEAAMVITAVPVSVPLADVYQGVEFRNPPQAVTEL